MNESAYRESVLKLVVAYRESNRALLEADPAFASWLDDEYVPMVGAWQY
ncbi:hypothetical protein [Geodermatophilus marinus]|nr:hypothetical protein [Geodermatophilus sp. LHW52908]